MIVIYMFNEWLVDDEYVGVDEERGSLSGYLFLFAKFVRLDVDVID